MHPTGMHSCFEYGPTDPDLSSIMTVSDPRRAELHVNSSHILRDKHGRYAVSQCGTLIVWEILVY